MATDLFQSRDPAVVLHRIVTMALALTEAEAAHVLLYQPAGDVFVPAPGDSAVGLDERWLQRQGLEATQALATQACAVGTVVDLSLSTSTTPGALNLPFLTSGQRPRGVYSIPLRGPATVLGAVITYVTSPEFTQPSMDVVNAFARLAALALSTAQAFAAEHSQRLQLEVLDEATKGIAAELGVKQVLQRIVETAASLAMARPTFCLRPSPLLFTPRRGHRWSRPSPICQACWRAWA